MSFQNILMYLEKAPIMTYSFYFFVFNIAITILEIGVDYRTKKQRRWKDTRANILIFGMSQVLEKTSFGLLGLLCLYPIQYYTPLEIPMTLWTWVLGIVIADFTYYWMHRIEHTYRLLWANHSVHHSSQDYNLTIAMRLSLIESAVEWIFLIPMVAIGFSTFQALVCLLLVAQYQTWIHTERIGKLGWLDKVFNTPSVHRVHHGSNALYLDKNYGGILILWDQLFGTYQKEEENVVYGLTKNIETSNPITINFIAYKDIWVDVKRCTSWRDKMKIVFGKLNWKPDDFKE